jgi:excisionase family DNA binding protein
MSKCSVCSRPLLPDGRHAGRPVWLNAADVAAMLDVSKMTIYRLTKREELHAVKVGRQLRISATSVDHFIAENTTGGDW